MLRSLLVLTLLTACGEGAGRALEIWPGFPPGTSRLEIDLDDNWAKLCTAGLVSPVWALTAAHCFSDVQPLARGRLPELGRGFAVSEVRLHPEAHRSGSVRIEATLDAAGFVAAHDLALIALPTLDENATDPWREPRLEAGDPKLVGARALFGRGRASGPETAETWILGLGPAARYLGDEQPGDLLWAQGAAVLPGDSGSLVLLSEGDSASGSNPPEAAATSMRPAPQLLGVIQDAHPYDPLAPFGVVPTFTLNHAAWLQDVLAAEVPAPDPSPPQVRPL